ncbi:hypothetical protein GOP47_0009980 [Adiantum capillus-veneris]|uniref:Pentatricopeptide repeat-containing protein n=1 Tax=Adiantum capillus-veneris TaxID=13818 RepID=A0A9D4UXM6_ADICA|nr:hypothetical protein GOP47_0009980 [Adiantum capillus-veneris]
MKARGFSRHLVDAFWKALPCLEDGILPQHSSQGMARVLDECQSAKETGIVMRLHGWLCESGVDNQTTLANYVVAMLVEAGSMCYAQQIFCRLTTRIEASWSSLITGLIRCGKAHAALTLLPQMKLNGFMNHSGHIAVALLQACAALRDLENGLQLHADIMKTQLLQGDPFVGSALLHMYAKCGSLEKAQEVFNKLPVHDVVSWTTLITGYIECGHGKEALKCLENMQSAGMLPDALTFVCGLKACGNMGVPKKIQELHADIERRGLLSNNLFVGSALIDMYAKCGFLVEAQRVFDKLEVHDDVVLWNTLISGYIARGQNKIALNVFQQMKLQDVAPDGVTFVQTLKACSNLGSLSKGQEIHTEVARKGLLERYALLGSTLVDMYMKCDSLMKAQEVFDKLLIRDSISWNIMISGYVEHGCDTKALECFEKMLFEGFPPDNATYASVLRLYGSLGAVGLGEIVHAEIVRDGLLDSDLLIGNNLIEMYVKFLLLTKARQVFDGLPVRDVVSWNILITGYVKHGYYEEALHCYVQLRTSGVCPDVTTFVCCLNIFANLEALGKGQELHSELGRLGLVITDVSIASALVDMYAKCGFIAKAEEVFNSYPVQDVVMWNALISGYAEHNYSEGALSKFEQMQLAGCSPSLVTVVSILKACGKIGAIHKGEEIHAEVVAKGLFDGDLMVGNTLIDMYAKAGALITAQQIFDQLPVNIKDVSSWNALIAGYAQLGKSGKVFLMVAKMLKEGKTPDAITFVILLSACSRAHLFEKGLNYGEVMKEVFGIVPLFGHCTHILDGLSRVGELERAVGIIEKPPFFHFMTWRCVLRACKEGGNVELGETVFEHTL